MIKYILKDTLYDYHIHIKPNWMELKTKTMINKYLNYVAQQE